MKQRLFVGMAFFLPVLLISVWFLAQGSLDRDAINEAAWRRLPQEIQNEHWALADLVEAFDLDFHRRPERPISAIMGSGARQFVLVESKELTYGSNTDALYFWPGQDTPRLVDCWSYTFVNQQDALTEASLDHPLSIEQLFTNPEGFISVLASLTGRDRPVPAPPFSVLSDCNARILAESTDSIAEKARFVDFWGFDAMRPSSTEGVSIVTAFGWYAWESEGEFLGMLLLHEQDKASQFDDISLMAWPSKQPHSIYRRERSLVILNEEISERNIALTSYGLIYPITIENLVNEWESVWTLTQSLPADIQEQVRLGCRERIC